MGVNLPQSSSALSFIGRLLSVLLVAGLVTACDINGFNLGGGGQSGVGDGGVGGDGGGGGGGDGGMNVIDAGPTCVPTQEKCDEMDNDCDGKVDEDYNLDGDPKNCGTCGTQCSRSGTIGTCNTGTCEYECRTGFIDLNDDILADGCEYFCTPTLSDEVGNCDLTDNDCDGKTDEDIDITTNILNCGGCGNVCPTFNTTPVCVPVESDPIGNPGVFDDGQCQVGGACNCTTAECFASLSDAIPGCEYKCPVPPTSVGPTVFETEVCDGIDQDCTGVADDNLPPFDLNGDPDMGADNSCHPYIGTPNAALAGKGVCNMGTWACTGTLNCSGAGLKQSDFDDCGGGDVDCDDSIDEDGEVDAARQTDVKNCGSCGNDCTGTFANATATCSSGSCDILACKPGWHNIDGNDANGCEYQCDLSGIEVCDGLDNDCDGYIDVADTSGVGNGSGLLNIALPCKSLGDCALTHLGGAQGNRVCGKPGLAADSGTTSVGGVTVHYAWADLSELPSSCGSTPSWYCPFDTDKVTVDPSTCAVVPQENECDGFDNDCDGLADDHVANILGDDCNDASATVQGICISTGKIDCTDDETGTECDFSQGTPGQTALTYEECNSLDDDCDGDVDEDAVDDMVPVSFTVACVSGQACSDGFRSGTCENDGSTCTYWVDKYEASRPDASSTSAGIDERLSCSLEDKIPWALITETDAELACEANGKRLCTQDEWQLACEGASGFAYPYGDSYEKFTCNGADWNDECQVPGLDEMEQVFPTGFGYSPGGSPGSCPIAGTSQCVSEFGTVDMSGNLREWTGTNVSGSYKVRGGSYTEQKQGITCDNDFITLAPSNSFANLGFRCCRDTQPPQAP